MVNLKITDLKKHLKDKNQEDLVKEIIELTKQFPDIKEYFAVKLNQTSENEVFEKYKKIINNEFLPDKGFGKMRYSIVKEAIGNFKRVSNNVEKIAELMLFYAEIGVEFTTTFGDIDERFYLAIEKAYLNALEYIYKKDLQDKFKNIANEIRVQADGIGWGFTDAINEIYYDYYNDDDEDEEEEE